MIRIEAFRTSDGVMHASHADARRHADKRYGDALTATAHRLAKLEKYTEILDFLDGHTEYLAELSRLKADRDSIAEG